MFVTDGCLLVWCWWLFHWSECASTMPVVPNCLHLLHILDGLLLLSVAFYNEKLMWPKKDAGGLEGEEMHRTFCANQYM